jgi:hypothetical protein
MPIPTSLVDLSTTAALNSPAGTENAGTMDDYFRAYAALLKLTATPAASITAASSLAIPNDGATLHITGNATISAFTGGSDGRVILLTVGSAVTLVHGASLVTPSGANVSLGAWDFALIERQGGVWYVRSSTAESRQLYTATAAVPSHTPSPNTPYVPTFSSASSNWTLSGGDLVVPVTGTYEIEVYMRPSVTTQNTAGSGFILLGLRYNGTDTGDDIIVPVAANTQLGVTLYMHRMAMPITAGGLLSVGILANASTVGSAILSMNARRV